MFDDVIDTDGDEVADYAVYSLSLKEDAAGLIDDTGTGECDMQDVSMLPSVKDTDVVVIGVLTPAIPKEEPGRCCWAASSKRYSKIKSLLPP